MGIENPRPAGRENSPSAQEVVGAMIRKALLLLGLLFCGGQIALADFQVSTEHLRLTFDSGGQLQSVFSCFPSCSGDEVRIQQFGDQGVIVFDQPGADGWQQTESRSSEYYELHFQHPGGASVLWRIPATGYLLDLELSGIEGLRLRSGESFRPRDAAGFGSWLEQARYVVFEDGGVRQIGFDETEVGSVSASGWIGYRNRYWTMMALPPSATEAFLRAEEGGAEAELRIGEAAGAWSIYLGPIEPNVLKRAEPELTGLLFAGIWFWLRWICFGMFHLLAWIQAVVPSWGLAVMCLSVAVSVLMFPLSRISDRLQQQVQETEARLAPELGHIKKNYKGEEQSVKILALYKSERVHPLYSMKSMLGVALVIPVFIGAFGMLAENIHLLNAEFLWITDLSRPDDLFRMPFQLPFFGAEFNLLPFMMTGLSVIASALHNPLALDHDLRVKQVRNMVLLAVAFFVLFYTFPAGMVLYWTTNNLISVIKNLWARR
jgi:YidC/Oxa1 family membrane protein insertase